MLHRMLVNPAYAGTFVYGRTKREVMPGDPPAVVDRRLAPEAWDIVVPDVYPAYLSFDAYRANRRQLADNRYNFAQKRRGAPRDGSALLAGLIRCGRCGRQMGGGLWTGRAALSLPRRSERLWRATMPVGGGARRRPGRQRCLSGCGPAGRDRSDAGGARALGGRAPGDRPAVAAPSRAGAL